MDPTKLSFSLYALAMGLAVGDAKYFTPPIIEQAAPVAGQPITFAISSGLCDGILAFPLAPQLALDQYRQVQLSGNTITVTLSAAEAFNDASCFFNPASFRFSIGSFSTGDFTLVVQRQLQFEPSNVRVVGQVPFVVSAPGAVQVPTAGPVSHVAIFLLLLIAAATQLAQPALTRSK